MLNCQTWKWVYYCAIMGFWNLDECTFRKNEVQMPVLTLIFWLSCHTFASFFSEPGLMHITISQHLYRLLLILFEMPRVFRARLNSNRSMTRIWLLDKIDFMIVRPSWHFRELDKRCFWFFICQICFKLRLSTLILKAMAFYQSPDSNVPLINLQTWPQH